MHCKIIKGKQQNVINVEQIHNNYDENNKILLKYVVLTKQEEKMLTKSGI